MAKYLFPAVFTQEDNGQYSVNFPDVPQCYTCGDDLQDAFDAAHDVLSLRPVSYTHLVKKVVLQKIVHKKFSPAFSKRPQIPKAEPLVASRRTRNPLLS